MIDVVVELDNIPRAYKKSGSSEIYAVDQRIESGGFDDDSPKAQILDKAQFERLRYTKFVWQTSSKLAEGQTSDVYAARAELEQATLPGPSPKNQDNCTVKVH